MTLDWAPSRRRGPEPPTATACSRSWSWISGTSLAAALLGIDIVGFSVEPHDAPSLQPRWFDTLGVIRLVSGLPSTGLMFRGQRATSATATADDPREGGATCDDPDGEAVEQP